MSNTELAPAKESRRARFRRLNPVEKCLIYGLRDPRDGRIRYVGQTRNGIGRAYEHATPSRQGKDNYHKINWVNKLKSLGLRYEVVILETLSAPDGLDDAECKWIAIGRAALGSDFTNATAGGQGNQDWTPPAEWREKQSRAQKGKPKSPETVAKMKASFTAERRRRQSEKTKGSKRTPEQIARRIAACKPWTPERLAKHLAVHVGRKRSPETRAKIADKARANHSRRQRTAEGKFA